MSGEILPGPLGTVPPFAQLNQPGAGSPPSARFEDPGPIGVVPTPLDTLRRIITDVRVDWRPPNPKTTPKIVVGGATLAEVAQALNQRDEWGRGGGSLRVENVPVGTSTSVVVTAHANLIMILPEWTGYEKASAAAQAEWNRMFANLARHEDRHVEIAVEEADALADALKGVEIAEIGRLVTDANARLAKRQKEFDDQTAHGENAGVTLNISIA
jgi:hypothetical protein